MSDGSFNMIDSEGYDVEINVFEMGNGVIDTQAEMQFETAAGDVVTLPEMVKLTDNTFGFTLPDAPIPLADVEHIGRVIEALDEGEELPAFVVWVNLEGWGEIKWHTADDEFREAWAGSYESYADSVADEIKENVPEMYQPFIDAEKYGQWAATDTYIVEEGEDGTLHFFRNS